MNRWIPTTIVFTSLMGTLALGAESLAFADETQPKSHQHDHDRAHRGGLIGAALALETLTPTQRTSIEQLVQQRRAAAVPVRQADAQVLTALAQQVEQAKIDPQAIAPSLDAEQRAATAEEVVDAQTLNQLHQLLTAAQRSTLVDTIKAGHPAEHEPHRHGHEAPGDALNLSPQQQAQIAANFRAEQASAGATRDAGKPQHGAMLEAFRGDSFDARQFVRALNRGAWAERRAQAMVPVLTPAQRAVLASRFRARAARES
jgi:Spy/CpxP family protein refolding chaperone